jgi:hypothetical protein
MLVYTVRSRLASCLCLVGVARSRYGHRLVTWLAPEWCHYGVSGGGIPTAEVEVSLRRSS